MINNELASKIVAEFITRPEILTIAKKLVNSNNDINRLKKFLAELTANYRDTAGSKKIKLVPSYYWNRDFREESSSLSTDHSSEEFYIKLFAKSLNKKIMEVSRLVKNLEKEDFSIRTQFLISLYTLSFETTGVYPSRQSKQVLKQTLASAIKNLL